MKLFVVVLVSMLTLPACVENTRVTVPIRAPFIQSPELREDPLSFRANLLLEGTTHVAVVENVQDESVARGSGWVTDDSNGSIYLPVHPSLGVTLFPRTEINFDWDSGNKTRNLNFKYQLYGKTRERSEHGNISATAMIGFGTTRGSESGGYTRGSAAEPISVDWDGSYSSRSLDVVLATGYRLTRRTLVYGGPFISRHEIESRFVRNDPAAALYDVRSNDMLWVTGLGLGFEFGFGNAKSFTLGVEGSRSWMSWDQIGFKDSESSLSLSMGYHF